MLVTALILVLSSGFLHSVWNLYTKKSINKSVFLWLTQLVAILVFLPWAISETSVMDISNRGLWFLFVSMILHGVYVILLAKAYTLGDLSQVYPIMRGTSPLLVPLLAVVFLKENLSVVGWIGVGIILLGIVIVSDMKLKSNSNGDGSGRTVLLALGVGICIALYIIIDKIAIAYVSPVILNESTNIGNVIALLWIVLKSKGIQQEWRIHWKTILLGGIIAPGGYLLFLYAMSTGNAAQLAPIREMGTVFGTLLGVFILHESQGNKRILASILITAGVLLLGIWGV